MNFPGGITAWPARDRDPVMDTGDHTPRHPSGIVRGYTAPLDNARVRGLQERIDRPVP